MRELSDGMKLVIFITCAVAIVLLIAFVAGSAIVAYKKSQIREWRTDGATIIVNGNNINPDDIQNYSQNNGVLEIHIKNGQRIETSMWAIITPAPKTDSIEK
jgi:hypothetical protein